MRADTSATCSLLGLRVDCVDQQAVLDRIFGSLARGEGGWVVTANLDFIRHNAIDAQARALYGQADLCVADGMPLVWAARLQGQPVPERVAGSTLVDHLVERAAAEGRSLYMLGGTDSANRLAAERIHALYPILRLCGRSSPSVSSPPNAEDIRCVADTLLALRPDIVLVGLGSPKQEQIIAALRPLLPRTWMMGVGITFSFLAGEVHRAPVWMQRIGLEWMHRMVQNPSRLVKRYLVEDFPFAFRLFASALVARVRNRGHLRKG
jgi:N-acetylglucosaminyldiphosphoundecaprenol N-acetyl-beta-D-mannosaminyltransferase